VLAPAFDDDPRLGQRVKDFPVQQFVVQLAVAALAIAVFPGTSGLDRRRFCAHRGNPPPYGLGDEFRTVVRADMARCPAQDEQVGQHIDHVRRLQLPGNPDAAPRGAAANVSDFRCDIGCLPFRIETAIPDKSMPTGCIPESIVTDAATEGCINAVLLGCVRGAVWGAGEGVESAELCDSQHAYWGQRQVWG
jgi:hypothetical protein